MEIVNANKNVMKAMELYYDEFTTCNDCKKSKASIVIHIGSRVTYLCQSCAKSLGVGLIETITEK